MCYVSASPKCALPARSYPLGPLLPPTRRELSAPSGVQDSQVSAVSLLLPCLPCYANPGGATLASHAPPHPVVFGLHIGRAELPGLCGACAYPVPMLC
jgi:hypothetical protein